LFDDGPFCQQVSKLLQRYVRYPLEYIGGIDLKYSLENRPPVTRRGTSHRPTQSSTN